VGNGAIFDARGSISKGYYGRFFKVGAKAALMISNVTLRNGLGSDSVEGGAVHVEANGTFAAISTTFSGNTARSGRGGAVYVEADGIFTATSCTFSGNTVLPSYGAYGLGGAVYVYANGTFAAINTTFSGNNASGSEGIGGAVYVHGGATWTTGTVFPGGTFTATSSTFSGNTAILSGGALYFGVGDYQRSVKIDVPFDSGATSEFKRVLKKALPGEIGKMVRPKTMLVSGPHIDGATGLIKDCTFVGPISNTHNDIYNKGGKITFACADDEVGTPVQMQGNEITVIPPKELKCTAQTYACYNGGKANWKCVPDLTSKATLAQCHEICAP
jgi:predicted outer membrane repeat protein